MGSFKKKEARIKRKKRIRKTLSGTLERPRLSVFRSAKHIYAQIIDDISGHTIAAASSCEKKVQEKRSELENKIDVAKHIGQAVAKRAIEKGVKQVVFDRSGYLYHGRIKALSDGARDAGLKF